MLLHDHGDDDDDDGDDDDDDDDDDGDDDDDDDFKSDLIDVNWVKVGQPNWASTSNCQNCRKLSSISSAGL